MRQAWLSYRRDGSEDAFAQVVRENANLVYSAAVRCTRGDVHLAEEIAQSVFQEIARKPEIIPEGAVLAGWLYRHTCFKASQAVRDLSRKRRRELMAAEVHQMNAEKDDGWDQIASFLDPLMKELKEGERNALVLRFLQGLDLKSVGAELGLSEDAAQKKVARALEVLGGLFMQRGVTITAITLAAALELNARVQMPSASLAALLALSKGTTAYTASFGAISGLIMKTHHVIIATFLIGGAATLVFLNQRADSKQQRSPDPTLQDAGAPGTFGARTTLAEASATVRSSSAPTALNRDQYLELMRLRGEVTQLKEESRALSKGDSNLKETKTNSIEQVLTVLWSKDATDSERFSSAEQLRKFGEEVAQAIPEFIRLLHSDAEATRYGGARALAFASEANPAVFEELKKALTDSDPSVRDAATHGVGVVFGYGFEVDYASAIPLLLQNLNDPSRTVRADTAASLAQYIESERRAGRTANPNHLVPALLPLLNDQYEWARIHSMSALEAYEADARGAVPQLQELLQDPNPQVQKTAEGALRRILQETAASNY